MIIWLQNILLTTALLLFFPQQSAKTDPAHNASSGLSLAFETPREETFVPSIDAKKSIRVVTWNIDRGTELKLIGDELQKNPADLYLLQEVDSNTKRAENVDEAAVLAKRLKMNMRYAVEFEELSQESKQQESSNPAYTGQATLTRLPIRNARILRFQHQSGFWKPRDWIPSSLPFMQRRLGNRIALVTDLEFAGKPLIVYNLHLESRSMGKLQDEQLDEVLADMKRYPPNTAFLVAGDFNTKYLPSIFLHKLERAGFHSATGNRVERTHKILLALDWIFVRGPIRVEDGRVNRNLEGSDHYPLYTEVVAQ